MKDDKTYLKVIDKFREFRKAEMNFIHKQEPKMSLKGEEGHLLMLISKGKYNQKQLAKVLHISDPTLSVRLKRLEDNGYIERTSLESDKRQIIIKLTKTGEESVIRFKNMCHHYFDMMMADITEEEVELLLKILDKFIKKLNGDDLDV